MARPDDSPHDPLAEIRNLDPIECGEQAATHFAFGKGYKNLNHGAYGTYPIEVRSVFRHYQERIEARPDFFTRYEYRPRLLDESRHVMATFLQIPTETCVLVPNGTTAFETVIRNLTFQEGDVIVCFAESYESYCNAIVHLTETTPVQMSVVDYAHPMSDDTVCEAFTTVLEDLHRQGKRPRIALFDTISSNPGTRMPFERLTQICRSHRVLSFIDGAHGIGQLDLSLSKLDPDFLSSNCHKWLYVPRPCAVLYVPLRNQHLIRCTLPTGFAFTPLSASNYDYPGPAHDGQNAFTKNFASTGTLDDTPYICIEAALEWRKKIRWSERNLQGEEAIMEYNLALASAGGQIVASALGTEVLDNQEETLSKSAMTNIRLPVPADREIRDRGGWTVSVGGWVQKVLTVDNQLAVTTYFYAGVWWVRLCAQIYLTLADFERAANILKDACSRANRGQWEA